MIHLSSPKQIAWVSGSAGVCLIALMILVSGPALGFGQFRPMDNEFVRYGLALVAVTVWGGLARRRQRARGAENDLFIDTLSEHLTPRSRRPVPGIKSEEILGLHEGLEALRRRRFRTQGGSYRRFCDLPWHFAAGSSQGDIASILDDDVLYDAGSGHQSSQPVRLEACEGTLLITEHAVFIVLPDQAAAKGGSTKSINSAWAALFDALERIGMPRAVRSVLVTVDAPRLANGGNAEIDAQARMMRRRLGALSRLPHEQIPTHLIITKTEAMAGFREHFADLDLSQRGLVLGSSFDQPNRQRDAAEHLKSEFDKIVHALRKNRLQKLWQYREPSQQSELLEFPDAVAALRRQLTRLVGRLLEPEAGHANLRLYGFYFVSTDYSDPSGRPQSYFLKRVLKIIVSPGMGMTPQELAEAALLRRARVAAFAAMGVIMLLCAAVWAIGFSVSRQAVQDYAASIEAYRTLDSVLARSEAIGTTIDQDTVYDGNLQAVLPALNALRDLSGEGTDTEELQPVAELTGLSRTDVLANAGQTAYERGLHRLLLPRLIILMEQDMRASLDDPARAGEMLELYLMIGGGTPQFETAKLLAWIRAKVPVWLPESSGAQSAVRNHAESLFRSGGNLAPPSLDATLVDEARQAVMSVSFSRNPQGISPHDP